MSLAISSPHRTRGERVGQVMRMVIYCTAPGMATLMAFFGWGSLFQVWLCILACVVGEAVVLSLRGRDPRHELKDCSAILTGLLLGLCLPPYAPWWIAISGSLFAIVVAKQLYGGLGMNPFNPAMVGYVFLLISFPIAMTSWTPPLALSATPPGLIDSIMLIATGNTWDGQSLQTLRAGIDGFTMATPLDHLRTDIAQGQMISEVVNQQVFGAFAGFGWEWVNLAFLIGGGVLLQQKIISWHIPIGLLTGLFGSALIFYVWNPDVYASPMFHLLTGGSMLGAFFIATDPVTACTSARGRWYYGLGIGVLVYVIRTFGGYPDAIAFAVLLLNLAAPTIDHYTVPRAYGQPSRKILAPVPSGTAPRSTADSATASRTQNKDPAS
ncbi:electron transport complex subunit RsxD [Permianibacter sp. IMCC34836]|uniref:electron transport complex subunit RsxD n=1 Tax=Permianibacter fluminis TaxID=2738515 RepID=UPI001556B84F|nr:electron transport complex subunit RsxD [Permianibacter fluminis]NQD37218.1 electron transport complex subunit RsxD [Permianibacter fluminis]